MFVYQKNDHWGKLFTAAFSGGTSAFGFAAAGLFYVPNPISATGLTTIAIISAAGGVAGASAGYGTGDERDADWSSGVLYIPYENEEEVRKLSCMHMPIEQGNK